MTLTGKPSPKLVALVKLKIANPRGPKRKPAEPSSIRVLPGEVFSLDGSEGIHWERLIQLGQARRKRKVPLVETPDKDVE